MTILEQASIDNVIIRASAGSGKTTALTNRYLQLLAAGFPGPSILAATFTRKAAGEILDRIMNSLADASLNDDAARSLAELSQIADLDRLESRRMLRHLLGNLHRLQVGTLDSFYAKLARAFSLEMGLTPDWDVAEARILEQLQTAAVAGVLSRGDTIQLLHLMAKGASIRGAHQLVMDTVDRAYKIFLDAPREAWFQLHPHLPLSVPKLESAIEQLSAIPIADKQMDKTRGDDVQRARGGDWAKFIETGLAAKIVDGTLKFSRKPIPEDVQKTYLPLIDHVRGLVMTELKGATESTYRLLERFSERFEALKTETGLLGFDDVTRRLVALLNDRRDRSEPNWAYRLDGNLNHLLLDEFQDTAPSQWQVIEPFARRAMAAGSAGSFFCVGDMKQAIYGWRGGVAEVFDLVEAQFPDLRDHELTCSHRSSQIVIDTVNKIFENSEKYESSNDQTNGVVRRWRERFGRHTTSKATLPGYATLERLGDGENPYASVIDRIKSIHEQAPSRRVAVLTRDNAEVKNLIFELQAAKIPASEEGGNPLTDSAAVLLILSLVQLSDHPHDSVAWFHVAASPLAELYSLPQCGWEWEKSPESLACVQAAAAAIRRDLSEQGYGASVARWAKILAPSCTLRELRRLQKLIELADQYDAEATLRPGDFVQFVQGQTVEDPTGSNIRVMTIHKAKGLEFDVVILPCLSKPFHPLDRDLLVLRPSPTEPVSLVTRYASAAERLLLPPEIQQAYDQQFERGLNEAICVLYVAVTRAIHALHMYVSPKDNPARQSMAGLLLASLTDAKNGTDKSNNLLFEHGDADWLDKLPSPTPHVTTSPAAAASTPTTDRVGPSLLPPFDGESRRGLPTVSPSQLILPRKHTIGQALDEATHSAAIDRGTLLHACLAQIQWLDNPSWRSDLRANLRRRFPEPSNIDVVLNEFEQMLKCPNLSALLTRANYSDQIARKIFADQILFEPLTATIENERPFAVRLDQQIVRGSIDRLVLIHEGKTLVAAEVIEYKTDDLAGSDEVRIGERVAAYQPQIAIYRRAVAQLTGLSPNRVFARLVLVGIDRDCEVR